MTEEQAYTEPHVINLSLARGSLGRKPCDHVRIEVDESLAEVLCLDCGKHLNPVSLLARFARLEIRFGQKEATYREAAERYQAALSELKLRNRVKCTHCGQMTAINKRVPS